MLADAGGGDGAEGEAGGAGDVAVGVVVVGGCWRDRWFGCGCSGGLGGVGVGMSYAGGNGEIERALLLSTLFPHQISFHRFFIR